MDIKVAVARAPNAPFTIESATLEDPRPGEVLVRIAGAGLCHTDLVARDQLIPIPLPAILGHEGAGVIERVGEGVRGLAPGDQVVMSFASCGHCRRCAARLPGYCREFPPLNFSGARPDGTSGLRIGGQPVSANFFGQSSFASHALALASNVVKVETSAPIAELGPLGCGLQTGAGGVIRALAPPAGASIAVFGGGPVGLAAVMAAKIRGCDPILIVEPIAERRRLALDLGATHAINPTAGDIAEAIRAILPDGLDFAFETSGRQEVAEAALASLASYGLLGLVGVPPRMDATLDVNLAGLITFGHRVHGIIEGDSDPQTFIPGLIAHREAGRFPFERLIATFPLDDINTAIEAQLRGDCVKAVLIP
jgi:aryl-alcohol dehydrogenase